MKKYTTKSLKINMILNGIKGIMSIIFPLITFPYVSRILGAEQLGRYNFSNSIISYFILISGLGINTYAVREGARFRKDKDRFQKFSNQMFSINIYATCISYVLLFIIINFSDKLKNYNLILWILSIQIILKTIGVEWIYSIYEDYIYITFRSIIVQIVSMLMLFIFVKTRNDLIQYTLVSVIANGGANIFGFFHASKYCKFELTSKVGIKDNLRPIMTLFAMTVTVTIYVSSDITILGYICNDNIVGIYTVSSKIYSIVKTLLSSVLVVSIPRLSALLGKQKNEEFSDTAEEIYNMLLSFLLPAIVGIIMLRKDIIFIFSGNEFLNAEKSLMILSVALLFCLGAWFWGQCILIPLKKENIVFFVTIISALTNVILNFLFIPIGEENAAAATTLIAEAISFIFCYIYGKKYVSFSTVKTTIFKILIGCILVCVVCIGSKFFITNTGIRFCVSIGGSIVGYILIELFLKNNSLINFKKIIKK